MKRFLLSIGLIWLCASSLRGQDMSYRAYSDLKIRLGSLEYAQYLSETVTNVDTQVNGETLLMLACEYGHMDFVRYLVEKGADVNRRLPELGWTALMAACLNGHLEVVRYLVAHGADLEAGASTPFLERFKMRDNTYNDYIFNADYKFDATVDDTGVTPLFWGAIGGHVPVIEYLVKQGCNLNVRTSGHVTPLMMACYYGKLSIVKFLVAKGADLHARTTSGATPLIYASVNDSVSVAAFLIGQGANINTVTEDGTTALINACEGGHADMACYLAAKGADLSVQGKNGKNLILEAYDGENRHFNYKNVWRIVCCLVEQGTDVNAVDEFGFSPLMAACKPFLDFETIKIMVEHGADVNARTTDGVTALSIICSEIYSLNHNAGIAEYLVAHGAEESLEEAAALGHLNIVKQWTEQGEHMKVDSLYGTRVHNGDHALMSAIICNRLKVVKHLAKVGVSLRNERNYGVGWLYYACISPNTSLKMIKLLVRLGADVNFNGGNSLTPLHVVTNQRKQNDSVSIAYYLRAHGATD